MRSVVVVLPASTCAMIPMFRVRSKGTARVSMGFWAMMRSLVVWALDAPPAKPSWGSVTRSLPAVVRERLVRVCHLVDVFALLRPRCHGSGAASTISFARRSCIVFSLRPRAYSTSQRIPSASERSGRTSTGTWYVEPPTRRLFTSTRGRTLPSARSHTFNGSSFARSATMSNAP